MKERLYIDSIYISKIYLERDIYISISYLTRYMAFVHDQWYSSISLTIQIVSEH